MVRITKITVLKTLNNFSTVFIHNCNFLFVKKKISIKKKISTKCDVQIFYDYKQLFGLVLNIFSYIVNKNLYLKVYVTSPKLNVQNQETLKSRASVLKFLSIFLK